MPNALIVSGGGSKGAFAVGAVKYLIQERGLSFDILAGTSTGALVTSLIAADGAAALPILEQEYTTAGATTIVEERDPPASILSASSLYTAHGLEGRIAAIITEERFARLLASGRTLLLATVELESGRLVYWYTGPSDFHPADGDARRITTRGTLMRALLASASIPVMMPPVQIDGRSYLDGGVREYAPIEATADAGATDIRAVILSPAPDVKPAGVPPFDRILRIGKRSLDLLMEESNEMDLRAARTYTDARRYLDDLVAALVRDHGFDQTRVDALFASVGTPLLGRRAASLRVIRPAALLPGDTLQFDPAIMRQNLQLGFDRAREVSDQAPLYAAANRAAGDA
jgi:NTE family protein